MRAIAFAEKASAWDPIRIPWSWIAIVSSQPGVANQFERSELACAIAQIPAIDNPDPGPNNSEGNPFLSVYSRPGDNLIPREGDLFCEVAGRKWWEGFNRGLWYNSDHLVECGTGRCARRFPKWKDCHPAGRAVEAHCHHCF